VHTYVQNTLLIPNDNNVWWQSVDIDCHIHVTTDSLHLILPTCRHIWCASGAIASLLPLLGRSGWQVPVSRPLCGPFCIQTAFIHDLLPLRLPAAPILASLRALLIRSGGVLGFTRHPTTTDCLLRLHCPETFQTHSLCRKN
jgi:hypothetical protein